MSTGPGIIHDSVSLCPLLSGFIHTHTHICTHMMVGYFYVQTISSKLPGVPIHIGANNITLAICYITGTHFGDGDHKRHIKKDN